MSTRAELCQIWTCRIDFQQIPGATSSQVYAYLARNIARGLSHSTPETEVDNAPDLIDFLCPTLDQPEIGKFVLLLEELGALPQTTREDLANVLRSLFTNRFEGHCRPLGKLMIIIAGSIELYELAATQVSTLHNICEAVYLPDLSQPDTVDLIVDGLTTVGLPQTEADRFGEAIFAHVRGHPYLTQRLGAALEATVETKEVLSLAHLDDVIEQLLQDDPLLRHLRRGLVEQDLLDASRDLLDGQIRFSRLDEEMARLELLGLARESNGYWTVRNPLFARALRSWLTISESVRAGGSLTKKPAKTKPPRIFVSSTWEDLQAEREAVEQALHRMRDTEFNGMEYFGSRPNTPQKESLVEVDRSDIYIGIFAYRYGSGITENEYRRARELSLPCLIYCIDDSVPVMPKNFERNPEKMARLEALKQELQVEHIVSYFKAPDQLASQVVADLHNLLSNG